VLFLTGVASPGLVVALVQFAQKARGCQFVMLADVFSVM